MTPETSALTRGPEVTPAEIQFVNKRQLARTLGVCVRTIDNWVQKRVIPSIPISPHCRRFILSSVVAALRRRETGV